MINTSLREKVAHNLNVNKPFLEESSLQLLDLAVNSKIYYPMLFGRLINQDPFHFDKNIAIKIIKKTSDLFKIPVFENYLYFHLKGNEHFKNEVYERDDYSPYLKKYLSALDESFQAFYSEDYLIEKFKSLTPQSAFENVVLDEEDVDKFISKNFNQVFDKKGWIDYYFRIISITYSDYQFDKSKSDTKLRFLKQLNEDFFFGFEYDLKEIKYQFTHGSLCAPDLKFVLIHKTFERNKDYSSVKNPPIWVFEPFTHPFFNLIGSLENTYARSTLIIRPNGRFEKENLAKQEILPDGKIRLFNTDEFGEYLQKSCFHELTVNARYILSYLNYIEKSILMSIEN